MSRVPGRYCSHRAEDAERLRRSAAG